MNTFIRRIIFSLFVSYPYTIRLRFTIQQSLYLNPDKYSSYQKLNAIDSPVRERIRLFAARSPEILLPILGEK